MAGKPVKWPLQVSQKRGTYGGKGSRKKGKN